MKTSHIAALLAAALPVLAHAQLNPLGQLVNAVRTNLAQQQIQQGQQPVQPGQGRGLLPSYGAILGCDKPATNPQLSELSLRNIKLGDVCAQTEFSDESKNAMAVKVTQDFEHLPPLKFMAETTMTDSSNNGDKVVLLTVRDSARPAAVPKSIIVGVEVHITVADVTNSLQPGNSFRTALEQKYGKPSAVVDMRAKLAETHQGVLAAVRLAASGGASKQDVDQAVSQLDSVKSGAITSCFPANTVFGLRWDNADGTTLAINMDDDDHTACGAAPTYTMSLVPITGRDSFLKTWGQTIGAYAAQSAQTRSATAAVPKF